jgi:hypothetical protein
VTAAGSLRCGRGGGGLAVEGCGESRACSADERRNDDSYSRQCKVEHKLAPYLMYTVITKHAIDAG